MVCLAAIAAGWSPVLQLCVQDGALENDALGPDWRPGDKKVAEEKAHVDRSASAPQEVPRPAAVRSVAGVRTARAPAGRGPEGGFDEPDPGAGPRHQRCWRSAALPDAR